MKHLTMRRKKIQTQEGEAVVPEQPSLNARWKQILEAADADIISPRDAIVGAQEHYENAYGANFHAAVRMLEQQADYLMKLADALAQVQAQTSASAANSQMIADGMRRQDTKLDEAVALGRQAVDGLGKLEPKIESLEIGQAALQETLGGVVNRVNDLGEAVSDLDGRMTTAESRLDTFEKAVERRFTQVEGKVDTLTMEVQSVKVQTTAMQRILETFPPPAEIQERMDNS